MIKIIIFILILAIIIFKFRGFLLDWLLEREPPPKPKKPEKSKPKRPVRHYIKEEHLLAVLEKWYDFKGERDEGQAMMKKVKFKEFINDKFEGIDELPEGPWFFKVSPSAMAYITDTEGDGE